MSGTGRPLERRIDLSARGTTAAFLLCAVVLCTCSVHSAQAINHPARNYVVAINRNGGVYNQGVAVDDRERWLMTWYFLVAGLSFTEIATLTKRSLSGVRKVCLLYLANGHLRPGARGGQSVKPPKIGLAALLYLKVRM